MLGRVAHSVVTNVTKGTWPNLEIEMALVSLTWLGP